MPKDDQKAQQEQASRWRAQIKELTSDRGGSGEGMNSGSQDSQLHDPQPESSTQSPPSARDFIEKRMRDIEEDKPQSSS